jgi:GTP-binding protein
MFVDKAEIKIKSGRGGNGCVSFRREPFVPDGGPDGGNGGNGGNIVFRADGNLRTLMDFKYKKSYIADSGTDGMGRNKFGPKGEDLYIRVPVGTLVLDRKTDRLLCDLNEDKQEFIAARGGRGGRGNTCFKNSVRQAPSFAEAGGLAQEKDIVLELKLLADIGLIGFPNVGKSTLLSACTGARPKIANYHFTTLYPNLGIANMGNSEFVLADIPGIIEGAAEGSGLGFDFLKHIERTLLLIHVVDISGLERSNPLEDFIKINQELENYSPNLAKRVQVVALNKTDILPLSEEDIFSYSDDELLELGEESLVKYKAFIKHLEENNYKYFKISAATGENVKDLIDFCAKKLVEIEQENPYGEDVRIFEADSNETQPTVLDQDYKTINIDEDEDGFVLSGKQLLKIFNSTNFNDYGSLRYLYKHLESNGVIDTLKEKGLADGDIIKIFDYEMVYEEES